MEATNQIINLILAEDQAEIRDTLSAFISFEKNLCCLQNFGDGMSAWQWMKSYKEPVHVALLDIDMPGLNGIELAEKIKVLHPETQILMCTIYDESDKIFAALAAGASGYILKKSPPEKIISAIREVFEGGAPMSAEIARRVVESFNQKPARQNPEIQQKLTPREQEILDLLSQGFLYKEIGAQLNISTETVRRHVHNIYEKLHVNNRTEALIKYAGN